jgi:signal transduction histidine kinase
VGGPGHLENTLKAINRRIFAWFFFSGVLLIGGFWAGSELANIEPAMLYGGLAAGWLIISLIAAALASKSATSPLKALSQAILHISPSPIPVKSPDADKLKVGRELVSGLIRQVYEMNTGAGQAGAGMNDTALQQLPVAVISIDQEANVTFANVKAKDMIGHSQEILGKNLFGLADIYFQNENTLQSWIEKARTNTITSQKIWHAVRIDTHNSKSEYIDLAASYSKQTQKGTEVVLVLFDETDVYAQQEQSLGFVSLAVHELRTPLTMLRGYIEFFEEEMGSDKPELKTYLDRTKAAAETLTAFVGNILNVARIDQNQLTLKLNKENWKEALSGIVEEMRLRAQVRGKQIELTIADGLPEAGIDRVSISEVMVNLLDNAIKYSPADKTLIKVNSQLNKEGQIETTVQDFGVGISENVLPHLFEKFSRSHRSKTSVIGTGLGLYLSNALIKAHGGNIWVRSKEGQGSVFGFTVLPYDKVAEIQPGGDNGITRNAHGWIKNHSLSRH